MDLTDILNKNWQHLRTYPGVLFSNTGVVWKDEKKTDIPCITVFVKHKKPLSELAPAERLPDILEGIEVDVIELDPKGKWEIGDNSVTVLSPDVQKRLANGVRDK